MVNTTFSLTMTFQVNINENFQKHPSDTLRLAMCCQTPTLTSSNRYNSFLFMTFPGTRSLKGSFYNQPSPTYHNVRHDSIQQVTWLCPLFLPPLLSICSIDAWFLKITQRRTSLFMTLRLRVNRNIFVTILHNFESGH